MLAYVAIALMDQNLREVVKPGTMEMEMEMEMETEMETEIEMEMVMEMEMQTYTQCQVVARGTSALKVAVPFEFCYRFV